LLKLFFGEKVGETEGFIGYEQRDLALFCWQRCCGVVQSAVKRRLKFGQNYFGCNPGVGRCFALGVENKIARFFFNT
jgi:hypothetical protein